MNVSSIHCTIIDTHRIEVYICLIRAYNDTATSTYLHRVSKQVSELAGFHAVNVEIDKIQVVRIAIQDVGVLLRRDNECQTNAYTIISTHRLYVSVTLTTGCEHDRRRLYLQSDITLLVRHCDRDTL